MRKREVLKRVAIFRAGDYGEKGRYTPADLRLMAAEYNSGLHTAPVTIDHTQSGPKWGEVVKGTAFVDGDLLFADVSLDEDFAPLVKRKLYDNRSVELYRDKTPEGTPAPGRVFLRALTFLGAQPPEVKGLPAIAMSEENAVVIEFSEECESGVHAIPPELNLAIEAAVVRALESQQKGASLAMTPEQIKALEEENAALKAKVEELSKSVAMMEKDKAKKMEEDTPAPTAAELAMKAEMEKMKAEMAEYRKQAAMAEAKAFSEALNNTGLPASLTTKLQDIRDAKNGDVVKFSDKTEVSRDAAFLDLANTIAEVAKVTTGGAIPSGASAQKFAEGRKDAIEFREAKMQERAKAIRASNPSIQFSEAVILAETQLISEGLL